VKEDTAMPKSTDEKSAPKAQAPAKTGATQPAMTAEVKKATIDYHTKIIARLKSEKQRIDASIEDHQEALKKLA
jgi:hypothetical protein